jgi:hypothetical protein
MLYQAICLLSCSRSVSFRFSPVRYLRFCFRVIAGAAMCHCTARMLVTNRLFAPAAQKLAGIHGVELVDRVRPERLAISSPGSAT